jgi:hypothetical protein
MDMEQVRSSIIQRQSGFQYCVPGLHSIDEI